MATALKKPGTTCLEAIIVGYDVAVRSALRMRAAGGPRKGSGSWGCVGAAAAAAVLLGLSPAQTANALGLAEYYAPQAGGEET